MVLQQILYLIIITTSAIALNDHNGIPPSLNNDSPFPPSISEPRPPSSLPPKKSGAPVSPPTVEGLNGGANGGIGPLAVNLKNLGHHNPIGLFFPFNRNSDMTGKVNPLLVFCSDSPACYGSYGSRQDLYAGYRTAYSPNGDPRYDRSRDFDRYRDYYNNRHGYRDSASKSTFPNNNFNGDHLNNNHPFSNNGNNHHFNNFNNENGKHNFNNLGGSNHQFNHHFNNNINGNGKNNFNNWLKSSNFNRNFNGNSNRRFNGNGDSYRY